MLDKMSYKIRRAQPKSELCFYLNRSEARKLWNDDQYRDQLLTLCSWKAHGPKQLKKITAGVLAMAKASRFTAGSA